MAEKIKTVIIAGPTAVGKTELAIRAAKRFDGEIISADSMQIYRYMDIGSAKPSPEELREARHYMVGEIDPSVPFSAAEYRRLAGEYIKKAASSGRVPIVSGGTGLYINSIIYEMDFGSAPRNIERREELKEILNERGAAYLHDMLKSADPEAAERIHGNNTKRVIRAIESAESGVKIQPFERSFVPSREFEPLIIILNRDRNELYERINARVDLMMSAGLVEEVKKLLKMGLTEDCISMKGIGYKEIIAHLNGEYDIQRAAEIIKQNTRRYAKRQLTWFRRYNGAEWIDVSAGAEEAAERLFELISSFL